VSLFLAAGGICRVVATVLKWLVPILESQTHTWY